MLLNVGELFEPAVAVRALVRLLPGVNADVLHQLVVRGERLQTLLALVRLHVARAAAPAAHLAAQAAALLAADVAAVEMHRRLRHQVLERERKRGLIRTRFSVLS